MSTKFNFPFFIRPDRVLYGDIRDQHR
jgi:hypothetical protein